MKKNRPKLHKNVIKTQWNVTYPCWICFGFSLCVVAKPCIWAYDSEISQVREENFHILKFSTQKISEINIFSDQNILCLDLFLYKYETKLIQNECRFGVFFKILIFLENM